LTILQISLYGDYRTLLYISYTHRHCSARSLVHQPFSFLIIHLVLNQPYPRFTEKPGGEFPPGIILVAIMHRRNAGIDQYSSAGRAGDVTDVALGTHRAYPFASGVYHRILFRVHGTALLQLFPGGHTFSGATDVSAVRGTTWRAIIAHGYRHPVAHKHASILPSKAGAFLGQQVSYPEEQLIPAYHRHSSWKYTYISNGVFQTNTFSQTI
jgi:hypothetical protein